MSDFFLAIRRSKMFIFEITASLYVEMADFGDIWDKVLPLFSLVLVRRFLHQNGYVPTYSQYVFKDGSNAQFVGRYKCTV